MRIISQNLMDFPYEQIVVAVDDNRVICWPVSNMGGRYYLLGKYNVCDRAREVFNSIFDYYKGTPQMEDGETLYLDNTFVMPEE